MATNVVVTLPKIGIVAETTFTVTQLRDFPGIPDLSGISDAALGTFLAAAFEAIDDLLGPLTVTERLSAHGDLLLLSQEAESIVTVVEDARDTALTLAADDYELSDTGQGLYRLRTGTNPRWCWHGLVKVSYVRGNDVNERIRAAVELVKLDLTFSPMLAGQTIGTWSETYSTSVPYQQQRDAILASLVGDAVMIR